MKSLILLCFAALIGLGSAAQLIELYQYKSAGPTKINNVEDGSKVYVASSDKALPLSKITLTSNGQTMRLDQLRMSFDDDGFFKGWNVNSDLTLSTANSAEVTENLNGVVFISSPDMAKDPNFLVYGVTHQTQMIDRSNNDNTTLVLLNVRVEKKDTDPVYKPLYNTRVEGFTQSKTTTLLMYRDIPGDGYTDPTYKETSAKLIFRNPVNLFPTGNSDTETAFFDNIEPIQYSLRTWHIRAIGGIKFNVSQEWMDLSTYQTTKETTTGYTMSQLNSYNSTVNFKYTPNHDGIFGYMITTADMNSDINVTSCYNSDCHTDNFAAKMPVIADFFQTTRNDTAMYIDHAKTDFGIFYLQYFRIEGKENDRTLDTSPGTTPSTATTLKPIETTTKSTTMPYIIVTVYVSLLNLLWVSNA